jgi:hypothetical protein
MMEDRLFNRAYDKFKLKYKHIRKEVKYLEGNLANEPCAVLLYGKLVGTKGRILSTNSGKKYRLLFVDDFAIENAERVNGYFGKIKVSGKIQDDTIIVSRVARPMSFAKKITNRDKFASDAVIKAYWDKVNINFTGKHRSSDSNKSHI